jgi:hypothetical protein
MTTTSVGTNVHQPLDVHRFPSSQVTFNLIVTFNGFPQCGDFSVT